MSYRGLFRRAEVDQKRPEELQSYAQIEREA